MSHPSHEPFRIVYLASSSYIYVITKEMQNIPGYQQIGTDPIALAFDHKVVFRECAEKVQGKTMMAGIELYLFSDPIALAEKLPGLEADLLILDERQKLGSSSTEEVQSQSQTDVLLTVTTRAQSAEISFENFEKVIKKFTPRTYHFPTRRILVVIADGPDSAKRSFHLGLANVRGVLVEPRSAFELIMFATERLYDAREKYKKNNLTIGGGGLDGYIYGLGAVHALNRAFEGGSIEKFDVFCGVSSGAILTSCLAAGIPTTDLLKQLYRKPGTLEPLTASVIFDLAAGEVGKRLLGLLKGRHITDPAEFAAKLESAVPVGFFKGEKLKSFIEKNLKLFGVEDGFKHLTKELYISATDQDTCEHVIFGEEPWRDVKISQAVRASTALPPFFLPEKINGHWFTDGQLTSSADFQLAIEKKAGLVVLIDPMVAYSSLEPGAVIQRGGFFACIQAVKSLVQTRTEGLLRHVMDNNPDVDFLLFQPTNEVMEAMAGVPMRYHIRTEVAELSFRGTLGEILDNYPAMRHKFAKHGLTLRPADELFREQERGLWLP